jgi:hypothetical protein
MLSSLISWRPVHTWHFPARLERSMPGPSVPERPVLVCTLIGCCVLTLVAFWPVMDDRLTPATGISVCRALHAPPEWLFNRELLMPILWICIAVWAGYCGLCLSARRGRCLAFLILGLGTCYGYVLLLVTDRLAAGQSLADEVANGNYVDRQWPGLERLRIVERDPVRWNTLYADGQRRASGVDTFADLHRYVADRYAEQAAELRMKWAGDGNQKRKALFIMNFVAGLWAYGNRCHVNRPGGVLANEENHWVPPPQPDVRTYLASNVGNCLDFACVTKSLLDHEGIENRLACVPGHCFNEARLNGRWHILDATANLCIEGTWEQVCCSPGGADTIRVLLFPHPGARDEPSIRYRPLTGRFRLLTLLRLAGRPASLRQVEYMPLPDYFD